MAQNIEHYLNKIDGKCFTSGDIKNCIFKFNIDINVFVIADNLAVYMNGFIVAFGQPDLQMGPVEIKLFRYYTNVLYNFEHMIYSAQDSLDYYPTILTVNIKGSTPNGCVYGSNGKSYFDYNTFITFPKRLYKTFIADNIQYYSNILTGFDKQLLVHGDDAAKTISTPQQKSNECFESRIKELEEENAQLKKLNNNMKKTVAASIKLSNAYEKVIKSHQQIYTKNVEKYDSNEDDE